MRYVCVQAFHVVVELTMSVTSSSLNRISKFLYPWKVLLNLQHNHINLPTTLYRVAALPREVRKSDLLLVACRSRDLYYTFQLPHSLQQSSLLNFLMVTTSSGSLFREPTTRLLKNAGRFLYTEILY